MVQLEHDDMQGFIARGYGHLPEASYLLVRIDDEAAARVWLDSLLDHITPSSKKPSDAAFHVAFTCAGLRRLGLHEESLKTFSLPFYEGMSAPRRARILGDLGESAPEHWRWGSDAVPVHILLMLFASDQETLASTCRLMRDGQQGVSEIAKLDTHPFDSPQEHFGFSDGIAQPILEGLSKHGPPENTLPAGEFILGYDNDYGKRPATPYVDPGRDPDALLPSIDVEIAAGTSAARDLGRNGSYLVFRQMSQDVQGFWQSIDDEARKLYGVGDPEKRRHIAAKMVGRWPDGRPLTLCPQFDSDRPEDLNVFDYGDDVRGDGCPVGAHIRRTNPRDALEGSREESIKVSNRHRLLRRGRAYGAPISRTIDVDEILEAEAAHDEVGLHFICLNADLARQFEFVQHTWVNNAKFGGMHSDADPLLGNMASDQATFTIQREPVRERITGMQRFVEIRGGAYFFLPGLQALRYLASL